MEKKHYIIIAVAVVVLIAVVLLWPRKKTDQAPAAGSDRAAPGDGSGMPPVTDAMQGASGQTAVQDRITNQNQMTSGAGLVPALFSPITWGPLALAKATGAGKQKYGSQATTGAFSAATAAGARFAKQQIELLKNFPLKQGSRGKEVENYQKYLNKRWEQVFGRKGPLSLDKNWGRKTTEAARKLSAPLSVSYAVYVQDVLPFIK